MDFQTIVTVLNNAVAGGIPIVLVVMGLVEFAKRLGLTGKALLVLSMGVGLVFGAAYQVAQNGLPGDFGGWFTYAIFGLAMGLVTSGIYDLIDARWPPRTEPQE
ncbi:MAG: hypothetical protein D6803_04820 [Anaerolineae bacterium]|nr:MAG: hypothetical protein D6803_04820 [Anaerolineae bacterium]